MSIPWGSVVGAPLMDVFGGPAVYFPKDGSAQFDVVGVFDQNWREVVIQDSLSYTSDEWPVIGITDTQFLAHGVKPQQDDKVQIMDPNHPAAFGKIFIVKEPRPDSEGITLLLLMEWSGSP